MLRFKLIIAYDGKPFVGWQRQDNGLGVQEVIERAVKAFSGEKVACHCAGRTDAGVHAYGQVAHFDLSGDWDPGRVRDALNANIRPQPISIIAVEVVDEKFHARFSAIERHYEYHILNRRSPPALELGRVWWVPSTLDAMSMRDAAKMLQGKHDFSSFRAAGCQAQSPIKTLNELTVKKAGDCLIINARARSFLYHQVRNIVGTLSLVGLGKWSKENVIQALKACDRTRGGPTAPSEGLFLVDVTY